MTRDETIATAEQLLADVESQDDYSVGQGWLAIATVRDLLTLLQDSREQGEGDELTTRVDDKTQ